MNFVKNVLELFGVVYLRFRAVPRIWCVWLVVVNAACLYFVTHIEGQVVLAVTAIAVVIQATVYGKHGFIRALGTAHVLWIPMFIWIAMRADTIAQDTQLSTWLIFLFVTNAVSLVVDIVDFARFVRGDRAPYYSWRLA